MHPRAYPRLLALLFTLLCAPALYAEQPTKPIDFAGIDPADYVGENWYLDTIDGKPSGYWRTWLAIEDQNIKTGYEEVSVETHDGELMRMSTRFVWTETLDYKPLSIEVQTSSSSDTVTKTYLFNGQGITVVSKQGRQTTTAKLPPIKTDYLTAAQQTIAIIQHMRRGDKAFAFTILDPLVGMSPYAMQYKQLPTPEQGKAHTFKLADGAEVKTTKWRVTYDILPGVETFEWTDGQLNCVGVAYDIGGMMLVARLADKSVTQTKLDPPEMAQLSVVVPDKPIKDADRQRKIVYELHYKAGDSDIAPINTTFQSVDKIGAGKVRVTVDLDAEPDADQLDKDRPTDAHLVASTQLNHKDRAVKLLADQAVLQLAKNPSTLTIAKACKRAVTRHLDQPTLAVGDATASEAARTGRGDCTERSVLLAAMLRAHGIPSRCVSGLVYSEEPFAGQANAFIYHQWTQAWIEDEAGKGRWVDLDAAMWQYSAGHIALGVSAMGDDDAADFIRLIPLSQDLQIKVIQTSK